MEKLKAEEEEGEREKSIREEFQHLKITQQWLEVIVVSGERQREVERDETACASCKQGERLCLGASQRLFQSVS